MTKSIKEYKADIQKMMNERPPEIVPPTEIMQRLAERYYMEATGNTASISPSLRSQQTQLSVSGKLRSLFKTRTHEDLFNNIRVRGVGPEAHKNILQEIKNEIKDDPKLKHPAHPFKEKSDSVHMLRAMDEMFPDFFDGLRYRDPKTGKPQEDWDANNAARDRMGLAKRDRPLDIEARYLNPDKESLIIYYSFLATQGTVPFADLTKKDVQDRLAYEISRAAAAHEDPQKLANRLTLFSKIIESGIHNVATAELAYKAAQKLVITLQQQYGDNNFEAARNGTSARIKQFTDVLREKLPEWKSIAVNKSQHETAPAKETRGVFEQMGGWVKNHMFKSDQPKSAAPASAKQKSHKKIADKADELQHEMKDFSNLAGQVKDKFKKG